MRRRDLFFTGLLLFSASAYAQYGPNGETEPIRYQDEARQVYVQTFDNSAPKWTAIRLDPDDNRPTTLYTWESAPVDSITKVAYYKRQYSKDVDTLSSDYGNGTATISKTRDWEIAGIRDTLIYLYNGVMRTDAAWPEDSIFDYDTHQIVTHTGESQSGTGLGGKDFGLDRYGEDGGTSYFRYTSANGTGVGNYSNGVVPSYRRNLFVRLNPGVVEPNSSYRVTVFVKAEKQAQTNPQMGLQLMRGSWHSEKDFSMSGSSTSFNNQEAFTAFDDDKWTKVTLMAYYLNDSVADSYLYSNGYWWGTEWVWKAKAGKDSVVRADGDTSMFFRYIQQPDKFFIRMSFRSDSTQFDVDNLSVTKSWIGGVDYYNDMIRVDFGYETNMSKLVETAAGTSKIAGLEVPSEYFDVWALWSDPDTGDSEWEYMDINSAEYQGDGYMYMWTKPYDDGTARSLDGADSILVTFRNPVDREDLKLTYSGSRYPNSLDTEWAKTKKVFDFHNENAAFNPTITISPKTKKYVKSIKNLPPVMQKETVENGTFGLPGDTRSFTFKFSRNLAFDNAGASTKLTQVTMTKGGVVEYWDIADYGDITNGMTTVTRPAKYTSTLEGDYVLSFKQVTHLAKGAGEDEFGDDVSFNYHFGTFSKNPVIELKYYSDWRSEIDNYNDSKRPIPTSLYVHSGSDAFQVGTGASTGTKCGLYPIFDDSIMVAGVKVPDNCLFYLSNRSSGVTGNLYSIRNLKKGLYTIEFKLGGFATTQIPISLFFYSKPEGTLENGNEMGYATLEGVYYDKIALLKDVLPKVDQGTSFSTNTKWKDGVETVVASFTVPADGDYVFEWVATGSFNYLGFVISNYWIKTAGGDISGKYVGDLNEAITHISTQIAATADAKYKGAAFNALVAAQTKANGFIDALTAASNGHAPSAYKAEIKEIEDAIAAMQVRMTVVDNYYATIDKVDAALVDETFKKTGAYATLENMQAELAQVTISEKSNDEIVALIADANAAINALEGIPLLIRRIQELKTLASELGSTIDQNDVVKDKLAVLDSDDDDLADVFKAAISLAIYQKAADNINDAAIDSLSLTPFIKNYFLYATPKIVERTDIKANSSGAREADPDGAQIQHVQHQWNSGNLNGQMPIWIMITENDYTTLYPGWTVRASAVGNCMVTPCTEAEGYDRLKKGKTIFDGVLTMEWTDKAEMKATVDNLPTGMYTLGVNLAKNTGSSTTLTLNKNINGAIAGGVLAADSVMISDGKIDIDFILTSGSGWSQADDFFLTFCPDKDFDYTSAIAEAQLELAEALTALGSPDDPDPMVEMNNEFYMENISCEADNYVVLPIKIRNDEPIVGFSLDVELPMGVSFVNAELADDRIANHNLSSNVDGRLVSLACISFTNEPLADNDGTVIYLTVYVPREFVGSYDVWFENMELTVSATKCYNPKAFKAGQIIVSAYVNPGDVNADGKITITDAVGAVNFIIGADTQGLNRRAADANRDGEIGVDDVVQIVNTVIRKRFAPQRYTSTENDITSSLSMEKVDVESGSNFSLPVQLNGMPNEITAMQFRVALPENISLTGVNTENTHVSIFREQSDGTYIVVCMSLNSSTFTGNGDAALTFQLSAGSRFEGGEITLTDISLVAPDCSKVTQDSLSLQLGDGGTTGVRSSQSDIEGTKYDLQGRIYDKASGIYIQNGEKRIQMK